MQVEFIGIREEIVSGIFAPPNAFEEVDANFYVDLFRGTIPQPTAPVKPHIKTLPNRFSILKQRPLRCTPSSPRPPMRRHLSRQAT